MKVVLSRKGFDSSSGGYPSPVIEVEGGKKVMLSMPIPVHPNDSFETLYSDLKLPENIKLPSGSDPCNGSDSCEKYSDIIRKLYGDGVSYNCKEEVNGKKVIQPLPTAYCHPDPDILNYKNCKEDEEWLPKFGQMGAAEGHLRNQEVGVGDLFLFFGRFQHVCTKGKIGFVGNQFHAIWGYLQIGEAYRCEHSIKKINCEHPHTHDSYFRDKEGRIIKNAIYEARANLSFAPNLPGAGVFDYNSKRELTKKGSNLVSVWDMPSCFDGYEITYHKQQCGKDFQSTGRGQEFVIQEDFNEEETGNDSLIEKLKNDIFFDISKS